MDAPDQKLLIDWCTRKDADSFQAIVQRHAAMVFNTALRILNNRSDAEDATQTCFEALATAKEPRKIQSLGAWLHGTTTNCAHKLIRTDSRRTVREHRYMEEVGANEASTTWQDIYPHIDEAIHSLDEEYRIPVIAHFLEGLPHSAIADELHVGRSTITGRIQKGVRQVETMLKEKGIVPGIALTSFMTNQMAQATAVNPSLISSLGKLAVGQGQSALIARTSTGFLPKIASALVVSVIGISAVIWFLPDTNPIPDSPLSTNVTAPPVSLDDREEQNTTDPENSPEPVVLAADTEVAAVVAEEPTNDNVANLSGFVVNGSGERLAGARVDVKWYAGRDSTIADEEGLFQFDIPKNSFRDGEFVFMRKVKYQNNIYEVPYRGHVKGDILSGYLETRLGKIPVTGTRVGSGKGALGTWETLIRFGDKDAAGRLDLKLNENGDVVGEWDDERGPPELQHIETPESITLSATYENLKAFPVTYDFDRRGRDDINLVALVPAAMSGHVKGSDGSALPKWAVLVFWDEGREYEKVETDGDGVFSFPELMPTKYTIYARSRDGNARVELGGDITLHPGETRRGIDIVYELGNPLMGTILDSDGKPVEGVQITAVPKIQPVNRSAGLLAFNGRSGKDGRFKIDGIPNEPGYEVSMQLDHVEYKQILRAGVIVDGTEQNFTFYKNPTIKGHLKDAVTGLPIERFRMTNWVGGAEGKDESLLRAVRWTLENNPDGAFKISAMGFNDISIAVSAPGYLTKAHYLEGVQPGSTVQDVEIRMDPVEPIHGRVVDSAGQPVPDARIYLGYPNYVIGESAGRVVGFEGVTQTDLNGMFTLTEYAKSMSVLSTHKPGYAPAWTELTFPTSFIEMVLTTGATIDGVITYDGIPVESHEARISVLVNEKGLAQVYGENDGRFTVDNIPQGILTLGIQLEKDGLQRYLERDIHVSVGGLTGLAINFETAYDSFIEGKLTVDGVTGMRAYLQAVVHFDNGDRISYGVAAGQDGQYRLGPIPAATFKFGSTYISREDGSFFMPEKETVTTNPGETTHHDFNYVTN
jgi:RNA polymerase sigma-70 factor (ECF subfamily)